MALAVLLLTSACHRAATPAGPTSAQDSLLTSVAALRERAERLVRAQDERLWRHWTEGAPLEVGDLGPQHQALYTMEALELLDQALAQTQIGALSALRTHFAGEYVALRLGAQRAEVAALEASLTFEADEEVYRLRELERLLARERNALKRQALHQAASGALAKLDAAVERLHQDWPEAREAAGYPSQLAFASAVRQTDLPKLAAQAEALLAQTEATHRGYLERLAARELQLPFGSVRPRDLPRMFRSRAPDDLFAGADVRARGDALIHGLGVQAEGLKIDDRALAEARPRPLAVPIRIPDEVRLWVGKGSGLRAQRLYLHELGHALHAAHTRQPAFELARLGGGAVPRAWSELLAGLTEDRAWLREQEGLSEEALAQHLEASVAWNLYLARRAAGRLLWSLAYWSGQQDPQTYGTIMARALGVPFEADDVAFWRSEAEPTLASATVLEAAFLAHQLRAQLGARHGPTWWNQEAAGALLKELWAHGTALNPEALAREAGEQGLSSARFIESLTGPP
jgi:hypothetical protein